jgi:hypothetical protein
MIATLRRLDDRERYWGLSWPGWVAVAAGGGVLYLAVRFSPLAVKPTITISLFVLAFVGMALYGVSGQALSPGRQLVAILAYHRAAKTLTLPERPDRRGLVLTATPELPTSAKLETSPMFDPAGPVA